MFAIMPTPISAFETTTLPTPSSSSSATPLQQTRYRPSISSPLSSSPIRAASYSPPAAQPAPPQESIFFPQQTSNSAFFFPQQKPPQSTVPRDTQSSPIAQPSPSRKLFKFATRTPRPNPVVQKREEARESRRKLFLKNVRERADDAAWERRGGDQEVLRLEWARLNAELRQQKEADLAVFGTTDADIEEAVQLQQEQMGYDYDSVCHGQRQRQQSGSILQQQQQPGQEIDDMMVDAIAREEEAEIEALLSSMPETMDGDGDRDMTQGEGQGEGRPESVYFSDDDDYDALFMELSQQDGMVLSQDTEMS